MLGNSLGRQPCPGAAVTTPTAQWELDGQTFAPGDQLVEELLFSVQLLSQIQLFATPWTAARQLLAFSPGKEQAAGVWET